MDIPAIALAAGLVGWTPFALKTPATRPVDSAAPAAGPIVDSGSLSPVSRDALADAFASAGLVAVGEKHDSPDHHQVQAEMLALLADRVPATAVGLEMVSYEDQPILDAFSSGAMSESAFAAWWKKNWGFDYALYRPVFDEARRRRLPLYGLNAPAALVKAVAKNGLAGLSPADRARLRAQISESSDARYRAYVYKSVTSHAADKPNTLKKCMISMGFQTASDPDAVARMLMAMAVWNETMGEQAARRIAEGKTLFLVAGQGHVLYKAGVPESAARRGAGPNVVLLPYPFEDESLSIPELLARLRDPAAGQRELADYFRLIPSPHSRVW